MNILDKILFLDNNFIKEYKDIKIDDNMIDDIIKKIDEFDFQREELIKSIKFDELKTSLSDDVLKDYFIKLSNNQNEISEITSRFISFYRKKLLTIGKEKKLNAYAYKYNEYSRFIDIKK